MTQVGLLIQCTSLDLPLDCSQKRQVSGQRLLCSAIARLKDPAARLAPAASKCCFSSPSLHAYVRDMDRDLVFFECPCHVQFQPALHGRRGMHAAAMAQSFQLSHMLKADMQCHGQVCSSLRHKGWFGHVLQMLKCIAA